MNHAFHLDVRFLHSTGALEPHAHLFLLSPTRTLIPGLPPNLEQLPFAFAMMGRGRPYDPHYSYARYDRNSSQAEEGAKLSRVLRASSSVFESSWKHLDRVIMK